MNDLFNGIINNWKRDAIRAASEAPPQRMFDSMGRTTKEWDEWYGRYIKAALKDAETPFVHPADMPEREDGPRRIRGQMPERTHEEKESSQDKFV